MYLNTDAADSQCYGEGTPALIPGVRKSVVRARKLGPVSEEQINDASRHHRKETKGNELQDEPSQRNLRSIGKCQNYSPRKKSNMLTWPPSAILLGSFCDTETVPPMAYEGTLHCH